MKKYIMTFFLLALVTLWGRIPCGHTAEKITMNLTPDLIEIGAFYNGTVVKVSGTIPAGAEAAIRLSGEGEDLHLKKKGKVSGLLWMNIGDLTFHNAPKVYKLYTSKGLDDLDYNPASDFGFAALINRIEISPAGEDKDFFIREFVRLKKEEDLYSQEGNSIHFAPPEAGMKSYEASLAIPPGMKPGTYTVETAVVQDGSIIGIASTSLTLKQVGFPAQLLSMAFGHAIWYGIMAVAVAIMAGLLMGILFKDRGGAH